MSDLSYRLYVYTKLFRHPEGSSLRKLIEQEQIIIDFDTKDEASSAYEAINEIVASYEGGSVDEEDA